MSQQISWNVKRVYLVYLVMYSIGNALPSKLYRNGKKLLFSKHLSNHKDLILIAINHSISTTQTSDIVLGIFSKIMKSAVLYQIYNYDITTNDVKCWNDNDDSFCISCIEFYLQCNAIYVCFGLNYIEMEQTPVLKAPLPPERLKYYGNQPF